MNNGKIEVEEIKRYISMFDYKTRNLQEIIYGTYDDLDYLSRAPYLAGTMREMRESFMTKEKDLKGCIDFFNAIKEALERYIQPLQPDPTRDLPLDKIIL